MKRVIAILLLLALFGAATVSAAGKTLKSKKGMCLSTKRRNADVWFKKVSDMNVSWHYSWGSALPEEAKEPRGVEFVPMLWGYWGESDKFKQQMTELTVPKSKSNTEFLLGWNEPDGKRQANLSVQRALQGWPALMKTNRRLGSPAAAHTHKKWLQDFMKKAKQKKYRVDFLTLHWYGGANAENFIKYVKDMHKMYGKPIWITEFAVADWKAKSVAKNRHSKESILKFMKAVLPELDKLDFVERYSWFSWDDPNHKHLGPSSLYDKNGKMTKLGKFYASHKK